MGKSAIEQSIVGENLVATIKDANYYTRTINKIFVPKMKHKTRYRLILDYDLTETISMDLDKDSLKGLADFIYKYLENE